MTLRRGIIACLIAVSTIFRLSAQEKGGQTDSLVRLLSAQSMELIEKDGISYRKVTGPARFLHNDTFLICDTALWNVTTNEIFAVSNVKILQNQTVLDSDRLTYYIDRNLAEFRGSLVQLEDKDHNVLRTEYLDYNTRDSVATFFNGGAMRDSDGQVIESVTGTYDSKIKTFTFSDNVNMFTDSIFVKTTSLVYDVGRNVADFGFGTDAWSDDNMLSSNAGWYDRGREVFLFRKNVHGMSDTQEGWADSLYYHKYSGDIELLGNAQVTDTTRDVSAVAGSMRYTDSLSRIVMTRDPAVIGVVKSETAPPDTVYFGADTMVVRSMMMFEIEDNVREEAKSRLDGLAVDAVQAYRQKAAQAAADAAAKNDPNRPRQDARAKQSAGDGDDGGSTSVGSGGGVDAAASGKPGGKADSSGSYSGDGDAGDAGASGELLAQADSLGAGLPNPASRDSQPLAADSLSVASDSLSALAGRLPASADSIVTASPVLASVTDSLATLTDSLAVQPDSLSAPLDSTKINFITAISRVKVFKSDFQITCDSLEYNDLDSLARLYERPVVWNEIRRQYSADSLYAVIRGRSLQKASLMSNAFVIVQEDSLCYDQIRSTEMLAYFDSTGALTRFDALGDASAIFYLQEDSVYATVNKSEAKMLYATFLDGDIDKVYYFESAKNDGYPLAQMKPQDKTLKGFSWQPELRPSGPQDITARTVRPSQRQAYAVRPKTTFEYTDKYYPGYMPGVFKQIEQGKVAKAAAKARGDSWQTGPSDTSAVAVADTSALTPARDSLAVASKDSLSVVSDSISVSDSLAVADSLAAETPLKDEKALKAEQRAAERAAKIAAREARWAQLDSLDAAKAQAKADRKAARLRSKKLKALVAMDDRTAKENARLERYKERYARQKAKADKRAAARAAKRAEAAARKAAPADTGTAGPEDGAENATT